MNEKLKEILKKFGKYALLLFIIGFAVLTYFLYNPPAFVITFIRQQAELQILKATDLYTSIDRISALRLGFFQQTAVAEGITILKDNTLRAPAFIKSEKVEIKFNVLSFLFLGAGKSELRLDIKRPIVDLTRKKNGEFDVDSPLFQPREKKEEARAEIPRILFNLQDGLVQYTDKTFVKDLYVNGRIPVIQAELQNSNYIKYLAKLYDKNDFVEVKGTFNTWTGQGSVVSKINIEDFTRWTNVFYDTTNGNFVLKSGKIALDLKANWENFKIYNLKFDSAINAQNIRARLPFYKHEVNIESISGTANENEVDIKNIILNSNGSSVSGSTRSAYNGNSTYVRASLKTDKLYLDDVLRSLDRKIIGKEILDLNLSGLTKANIDLEGFYPKINKQLNFLNYPESFQIKNIKGNLEVKDGTFLNSRVRQLSSKIKLDDKDLTITDFFARAYGGLIKGNLTIKDLFKGKFGETNIAKAYYKGKISASKVSLDNVFNDFDVSVPAEYRPYAQVSADVVMTGPLRNPGFKGKAFTPLISFNPRYSKIPPVRNVYADIIYEKNYTHFKTNLNSNEFGRTYVDFAMKNLDQINVKTITNNLMAQTLNAFIPNMDFGSGRISGNVNTAFSLREFKSFRHPTVEQYTHIFNVNGKIHLINTDLIYNQSGNKIKSTGTNGDIFLAMNKGTINSRFDLLSNEFGNATGNMAIANMDAIRANVKINNMNVETLENFIPDLNVRTGTANVYTNISTSLKSLNKKTSLDRLIRLTNTKTYISLNNTSLVYGRGKNALSSTNTNGDLYLNINNGNVSSMVSLDSHEFGKIDGTFYVRNLTSLTGQVNADNFEIKKLEPFVPNLNVKAGTADVTANFSANIKNVSARSLFNSLNTKGYISLYNASFNYRAGKENFTLTHAKGNIYINKVGNTIVSTIGLASDELGKSNIDFTLKDFNALNAKVDLKNISSVTLAKFIPNLYSSSGKVDITGDFQTFIKPLKNASAEKISSITNARAYLKLYNANLNYKLGEKKNITSTHTNGDIYLSMKNGAIASDISLTSNEFGNANAVVSIINLDATYAKIEIIDMSAKTLQAFVPNITIKSGTGYVLSTINTRIKGFNGTLTPDQITHLITTDTLVNFRNTNLTIGGGKKSNFDLTNGSADIKLIMKNGIVNSRFNLNSNEFGIAEGFINVDKDRNLRAKLVNRNIEMSNVSNFIPNVDITQGKGVIDITGSGNLKEFSSNPAAITLVGSINFDNMKGTYTRNNKVYELVVNSFHNSFSYKDAGFYTDMQLVSEDAGKINALFNINTEGNITGKIYSTTIEMAKINQFINNQDLRLQSGTGNINVDFKGTLNDVMSDPLNFQANGNIQVNDLKLGYTNKLAKNENDPAKGEVAAPIKEETNTDAPVTDDKSADNNENMDNEPAYLTQKIDLLKTDFNWNNGLINISRITVKNDNSEIAGKGQINVATLLNNPNDQYGNISLNSNKFYFKDFPITQLIGINDGEVTKLLLTANLSGNYNDISLNLDTQVKNLLITNESNIDLLTAKINFKNNILAIADLSLNSAESYFNTKGNVNLADEKNTAFNLTVNSRRFPIQAIISLIPKSILNSIGKRKSIITASKNNLKVLYNLPIGNPVGDLPLIGRYPVTFDKYLKNNKTTEMPLNKFIEYWEKWSLDPLTEQDARTGSLLPRFWDGLKGDLSITADLKGTTAKPFASVNGLLTNATIYGRKFNEVFVIADYNNGSLNLPKAHFIESEGGFLEVSGDLKENGAMNFSGDGKLNLNWAQSLSLNKSLEVEGDTVFTMEAGGTTENPDVVLSLDATTGGVFNQVYFDTISLLGSYKNNIVNIAEASLRSGVREAKAAGIIPLDEEIGSMNFSLSLNDQSLGLVNLFTNQIEWLKGDGDAFVNVQGSLKDPIINGKLNVANAQIFVSSLDENLEKVNLNIDLNNYNVKINNASAFLNDSQVNLLGQIGIKDYFRPGLLNLKLVSDELKWEQEKLNLAARVSLTIKGETMAPRISGKVQIKRGEMSLGVGGSSSSSKAGPTGKVKKQSTAGVEAEFTGLTIDIPKETDFWVRSPFFDLRPYGNINLSKGSITDPTILGFLGIDKGNLYLISNQFTIKEATANFSGKDFERDIFPINPILNVTADTKLINPRSRQDVDVEAKITGDLEDIPNNSMNITWTKTGGLTEAEIWTQVLGLNAASQILNDTGTSATPLAKFATPYFNRAIFNPLTSKVADFLGLDEFNVGLASDTVSNPGVSLSISKELFDRLSIGYRGTIRSVNQGQYNFFTRYTFNNNLSVSTSVDERNSVNLLGEWGLSF
jgi:hypothetical protein